MHKVTPMIAIVIELAKRGKARWGELLEAIKRYGYTSSAALSHNLMKLIFLGYVVKTNDHYVLTEKGWILVKEIREELLRIINEIPVRA